MQSAVSSVFGESKSGRSSKETKSKSNRWVQPAIKPCGFCRTGGSSEWIVGCSEWSAYRVVVVHGN